MEEDRWNNGYQYEETDEKIWQDRIRTTRFVLNIGNEDYSKSWLLAFPELADAVGLMVKNGKIVPNPNFQNGSLGPQQDYQFVISDESAKSVATDDDIEDEKAKEQEELLERIDTFLTDYAYYAKYKKVRLLLTRQGKLSLGAKKLIEDIYHEHTDLFPEEERQQIFDAILSIREYLNSEDDECPENLKEMLQTIRKATSKILELDSETESKIDETIRPILLDVFSQQVRDEFDEKLAAVCNMPENVQQFLKQVFVDYDYLFNDREKELILDSELEIYNVQDSFDKFSNIPWYVEERLRMAYQKLRAEQDRVLAEKQAEIDGLQEKIKKLKKY